MPCLGRAWLERPRPDLRLLATAVGKRFVECCRQGLALCRRNATVAAVGAHVQGLRALLHRQREILQALDAALHVADSALHTGVPPAGERCGHVCWPAQW